MLFGFADISDHWFGQLGQLPTSCLCYKLSALDKRLPLANPLLYPLPGYPLLRFIDWFQLTLYLENTWLNITLK